VSSLGQAGLLDTVAGGDVLPEGGEGYTAGSVYRMILAVFLENRLAIVGVGTVLFMVLFSFVGPLIYHTQQVFANPNISLDAPNLAHPLGTDGVGYDNLGRLMLGGQTSLEVGLAAALIAVTVGAVWGAIAGLVGGFLDAFMMRVMGGGNRRILFRHLIPNTMGTIVVNATFQVADAILFVATLSYLGLGIPAPATNWGGQLSDGVTYIFDGYWWLIYPAGVAIVLTVVAFNFIGDSLRDALEVRLQQR